MTSLHIELRIGESIKVSGPASLTLEEKSGQRARLHVQADESVRVERVSPPDSGAAQARRGIRPSP